MKTEYNRPLVVLLVYLLAGVVAIFAVFFTIMAFGNNTGPGPLALFLPAAAIALIGYALELLTRILHQLDRIRGQLEGTVTVIPPAPGDLDYFLDENDKSTGPFPLKVLLNRLRMGTLRGSAPVRLVGTKTWVELETLET
jgi:hypothetical protein